MTRLEAGGIVRRVSKIDWAAPVVVVEKKDGSLRLCGDYKVTINASLAHDQYPLPRPADLFATLNGGAVFCKLDLAQAYLQMELEESSKKFTTINTSQGLFEYQRLPFGVCNVHNTL